MNEGRPYFYEVASKTPMHRNFCVALVAADATLHCTIAVPCRICENANNIEFIGRIDMEARKLSSMYRRLHEKGSRRIVPTDENIKPPEAIGHAMFVDAFRCGDPQNIESWHP